MIKRSRTASHDLHVWMNGEPVGIWGRTQAGVDTFQYHASWMDSARGRPISITMPFESSATHRGPVVTAWFENLLPDSVDIRSRIARRFRVDVSARSLLREIGRDCVGAVQLLPDGEVPPTVDVTTTEMLAASDIARLLRGVTSSPYAGESDGGEVFRISLAGAQEKAALLQRNGHWYRPTGSTPSTHILKLPLGLVGSMRYNLQSSVENEWLCLRLLSELGFDVASATMATFEDAVSQERVLVVERFDRVWSDDGTHVVRLPQEDFCQAHGVPPTRKYETDGGPGIREGMALLRAGLNSEADVRTFVLTQLAFWLLAATDGHAKNFSIFLNRRGYVMTPLYDVISAWPIIGAGADKLPLQKARMAMALRGKSLHREIDGITTRHWRMLAEQSAVAGVFDAMVRMIESVPAVMSAIEGDLPQGFPESIWVAISQGMQRQCRKFTNAL